MFLLMSTFEIHILMVLYRQQLIHFIEILNHHLKLFKLHLIWYIYVVDNKRQPGVLAHNDLGLQANLL